MNAASQRCSSHGAALLQAPAPVPIRRVHRRAQTVALSAVDSVKSLHHAEPPRWQNAEGVSRLVDQEGSDRASLPQLSFPDVEALEHRPCPCGSLKMYQSCCGRLHAGAVPHHAAELARARFTAHLLGNLQHLEDTLHPDSPDQARPQLLAKACHVFQSLQPRLLDMCHGMVPGSDIEGPETHVVATALLIQRDASSLPCVYIEVDSYRLHDGQWMWYHKEQQMPTFGSFTIFWDKYGPGQQSASDKDPGRYRFDLVNPRRTPTARRTPSISRNPTPQQVRRPGTPAMARRAPTPSSGRLTPGPARPSPTPQPRRTPTLARKPTPSGGRLTPQGARSAARLSPAPSRPLPSPTPARGAAVAASVAAAAASTALATTQSIHQWLIDNNGTDGSVDGTPLLYMDDVDSDGENISPAATVELQAKQMAAQQQMMQMLMESESETDGDSWLIRQSGFRYET